MVVTPMMLALRSGDLPLSVKHHVKDVILDYSGTVSLKVKSVIKSYTEMEIRLRYRKLLGDSGAVRFLLTVGSCTPL